MSCEICVEDFDRLHVEVTCIFCKKSACTSCYERVITDGKKATVSCLHCKVEWSEDCTETSFPRSFISGFFKEHQKKTWVAEEKLKLHEVQADAEKEMAVEKIFSEKEKLKENVKLLKKTKVEMEIKQQDSSEIDDEIKELRRLMRNLTSKCSRLVKAQKCANVKRPPPKVTSKNCPQEKCRGFLNDKWECGLCGTKVCERCDMKVVGEHKCKKEDIKTVQEIEQETRPCPNCNVRVFKINGCDQMWCVNCHTPFSWEKGTVETGRIHNPHYLAWKGSKNKNGIIERDPLDIPCGGVPDSFFIPKDSQMHASAFKEILRSIRFIEYEMRIPVIPDFTDLRKQYIKSQITEDSWGEEIYGRKQVYRRRMEVFHLNQAVVFASVDLFNRLSKCKNCDEVEIILVEFESLREYYNSYGEKICRKYDFNPYIPRLFDMFGAPLAPPPSWKVLY